jgi:uncharacterized PurR-regulated membrane protein YhhQ (DUF165 family)
VSRHRWIGWAALGVWVVGIVGANWLVERYGLVTLTFPAGVWAAGLTFTARDVVQEQLGRAWVVPAIAAGAGLSAWLNPQLALASGVAFAVAELCDWLVYEPLRSRDWYLAVLASGLVGAIVDSALQLAGFPVATGVVGQVVAKTAVVAASAVLLAPLRAVLVNPTNRR